MGKRNNHRPTALRRCGTFLLLHDFIKAKITQVNFLNLDWWFRAGNSDTCIAEMSVNTSYTALKKVLGFFNHSFIAQRTNVASV
jgi:hypothetical protein